MSILSDMAGKGMETKIQGQKVVLKPLSVKELAEFAEHSQKKELAKAVTYLVETTLKKSIPDCTDEEIDNLPPETINDLIEKCLEVNKLSQKKKNTTSKKEQTGYSKETKA